MFPGRKMVSGRVPPLLVDMMRDAKLAGAYRSTTARKASKQIRESKGIFRFGPGPT